MNASSTITARSHAICSSLPPPTAMPWTRATVGLPISRSRSCISLNAPNHFQYSRGLPTSSAPQLRRSAPTQKARPSPVTTTTRMSSSQEASSHARASSRSIRKSNAFRTSSRLSVIVARGGAFSYRIDSKPSSSGELARGCVGSGNVHEVDVEGNALRLRVLDGRLHLLACHPAVECVPVGKLELRVLRVLGLAGGGAEDAACPEVHARHLLADLGVARVPLRVRRLLPKNDSLDHSSSSLDE